MSLDLIPPRLHQLYRFEERHHATSILATDFKEEFNDFLLCLKDFRLKKIRHSYAGRRKVTDSKGHRRLPFKT
jgi:hypothetical protein